MFKVVTYIARLVGWGGAKSDGAEAVADFV